jgi:carboxyl-terminal processing protease
LPYRFPLLEPGYAYVRISQFQSGTGAAFEATINELRASTGGRLNGLVLDLRNNPGGVLQASVAVADALLEEGLIVYTEGRLPSSKHTYRASSGDLLEAAPVVVLMNGGSASAAEIVAGALQDHGRATVMGSRSYGKGSVQSVMPLSGNQAIKLTTAYYFTPNGRSIHHLGIEPDLPREPGLSENADGPLLDEALGLLKTASAIDLHARL